MFRKAFLILAAPLVLAAQPVAAQDQAEEDPFAALAGMFEVEPLTSEQQARLPLAQQIVERIIPPGAMREMMDAMFNGSFKQLMEMGAEAQAPEAFVASQLGLDEADFSVTAQQATEMAAMFDPAREERKRAEADLLPEIVADMVTAMEPSMRKAMSELYAIHFSQRELQEINSFFSTDTGATYARKSFTMASDPRIVVASMEAMPEMMGQIGAIEKKMAAATANLPAERSFAELSADERARIAKLTWYSVEDLDEWSAPITDFSDNADGSGEAAEEAAEAATE